MSCPYFFRRSYLWCRAPDSASIAQQSSRRSSNDLSESRHRRDRRQDSVSRGSLVGDCTDAMDLAWCHDVIVALSVLIVDDHARFRSLARSLLEAEGFIVVGEAEDAASALALAALL